MCGNGWAFYGYKGRLMRVAGGSEWSGKVRGGKIWRERIIGNERWGCRAVCGKNLIFSLFFGNQDLWGTTVRYYTVGYLFYKYRISLFRVNTRKQWTLLKIRRLHHHKVPFFLHSLLINNPFNLKNSFIQAQSITRKKIYLITQLFR